MDTKLIPETLKPATKSNGQQRSFVEMADPGQGTEGEMSFHRMLAGDLEKPGELKPTTTAHFDINDTNDTGAKTEPLDDENTSGPQVRIETLPLALPSYFTSEGKEDGLLLSMPVQGAAIEDEKINLLQTDPRSPVQHKVSSGPVPWDSTLASDSTSQILSMQASAILDQSAGRNPNSFKTTTAQKPLPDPSLALTAIVGSPLTRLIATPANAVSQYHPAGSDPRPEVASPFLDPSAMQEFLSRREASEPAMITDKASAALIPERQLASPEHAMLGDGVFSITPPDTGDALARSHSAHSFVPIRVSVADPRWEQAFGNHIVWMAGKRLQSASLQLNPPDLGTVNVQLRMHEDNQASISFSSHHTAVREAIEAALPRLRELFTEGGLQLLDVEISNRGGTQHDRGDQPWQRTADNPRQPVKTSALPEAPVEATSGMSHQGLLDTFA